MDKPRLFELATDTRDQLPPLHPADMLSSTWGSNSQYSSTSYPSSTSSAQSYYRPIPNRQQNLPSLTEMNLNTPGYRRPPRMGSPTFFNVDSDLSFKPALASPYTPYSSYSRYTPQMESYSPTIDYYNGQSWPPSLPYPNYNISDTSSIGSGRRRRGNLPKHVTDILRAWFHDHLDHPYPTDEDKQMLISRTNLTISQISNWFINARRRHWPQLKAERERTLQVQGGYKNGGGKA